MDFISHVFVLEDSAKADRSVGVFAMLAWVALPYPATVLPTVSLIWRYKTGQYGWISYSSSWNESTILCWPSPMLHSGILFVGLDCISGLLVPKAVTETPGVSEETYHIGTTVDGGIAGLITVISLLGLLYHRVFVKSARPAITRTDIVIYVFLCLPVALGIIATVMHQVLPSFPNHDYDYRETISVWFRSTLMMPPKLEYILNVPLTLQMHIIVDMPPFCV